MKQKKLKIKYLKEIDVKARAFKHVITHTHTQCKPTQSKKKLK